MLSIQELNSLETLWINLECWERKNSSPGHRWILKDSFSCKLFLKIWSSSKSERRLCAFLIGWRSSQENILPASFSKWPHLWRPAEQYMDAIVVVARTPHRNPTKQAQAHEKARDVGRCLVHHLRRGWGHFHPVLECLCLSFSFVSESRFLFMWTLGGGRCHSKYLDPCHPDRKLGLGFRLLACTCPTASYSRLWGVNQWESECFLFLSPTLSPFQIT